MGGKPKADREIMESYDIELRLLRREILQLWEGQKLIRDIQDVHENILRAIYREAVLHLTVLIVMGIVLSVVLIEVFFVS